MFAGKRGRYAIIGYEIMLHELLSTVMLQTRVEAFRRTNISAEFECPGTINEIENSLAWHVSGHDFMPFRTSRYVSEPKGAKRILLISS